MQCSHVACAALLVVASRTAAAAPPDADEPAFEGTIVLNQVGFPGHWDKEALLVATTASLPSQSGSQAEVIELSSGAVAAKVPVGPSRRDPATGDWLRSIAITLSKPGRYQLVVGSLHSPAFEIGGDVYRGLERLLLRSFYLQRCGLALDDTITAAHHRACHLADGEVAPDAQAKASWDATGGWHDAGDYGKYVATTAVSIGRILHAYERDPSRYRFDDLGIPESGNGIPDVLDEMKVGLDWMLKMQRADGAVYRKVGGKEWPKKRTPEDDVQPRLVYGVTSPETAKAAAAWALAARLYREPYPHESARYLAAARRAWQWLKHQPAQVFDWHKGDDSGSGPYRSSEVDTEVSLLGDLDDRLWAATELAITTAEPQWIPIVTELARSAPINIYEWKDASLLALSYFLWHPALAQYTTLSRQIAQRILRRAEAPVRQLGRGYGIANQRFIWGSNKMTAEEAILMCTAYSVSKRRDFLVSARDQLHYLLGRNHFATSFVSGVGERAVRHVTHIFSEAANLELPGLFVGGPNEAEQSNIAPRHRGPLSWIDDRRSYATNEYAIDYNASLVGLIAALARDCAR